MKILDVPQSGSVAGVTSSRNRFGQYRRTRAVPVQPRTPKQTYERGYFTAGSSAWRTLSDAQRTGWADYAAQITRSGSLGSSYSPTGSMLFTGAFSLGQGSVLAAPPVDLPVFVLSTPVVTYTDPTPGPEALSLAIDNTAADNRVLVWTSGPVSPGVTSSAAVRRWRSLPTDANNTVPNLFSMASSPIAMLTAYKRLFPSPEVGQAIWFRFQEVNYPGSGIIPITNRAFQTFRLVIV